MVVHIVEIFPTNRGPALGTNFTSLRNPFTRNGNHIISLGNQFASIRNHFISTGSHFNSIGNHFTRIRKRFTSIWNRFIALGTISPALGTTLLHKKIVLHFTGFRIYREPFQQHMEKFHNKKTHFTSIILRREEKIDFLKLGEGENIFSKAKFRPLFRIRVSQNKKFASFQQYHSQED